MISFHRNNGTILTATHAIIMADVLVINYGLGVAHARGETRKARVMTSATEVHDFPTLRNDPNKLESVNLEVELSQTKRGQNIDDKFVEVCKKAPSDHHMRYDLARHGVDLVRPGTSHLICPTTTGSHCQFRKGSRFYISFESKVHRGLTVACALMETAVSMTFWEILYQ
jgi:hypothetical protein